MRFSCSGRLDEGGYRPSWSVMYDKKENTMTIIDTADLVNGLFISAKLPSTCDAALIDSCNIQCKHPMHGYIQCVGNFSVECGVVSLRIDATDENMASFYVCACAYPL